MKDEFPGYFRPTDGEFKALWDDATIVLDANVLLSLYGYSSRTRKSLLDILRSLSKRLWIPHQFAAEFLRNRPKAILEQEKNYGDAIKALRDVVNNRFKSNKAHPFVSKAFIGQLEKLCAQLDRQRIEHARMLTHDPIREELAEIFQGRVGPEPGANWSTEVFEKGAERFAREIPPGFADKDKPEPERRYGDLAGWMQILEYGSQKKLPTILVTEDRKEDWWLLRSGSRDIISPRPELVREYRDRTQHRFYMYGIEQFMRLYWERSGKKVAKQALKEVREQVSAPSSSTNLVKSSSPEPGRRTKSLASGDLPKLSTGEFPDS